MKKRRGKKKSKLFFAGKRGKPEGIARRNHARARTTRGLEGYRMVGERLSGGGRYWWRAVDEWGWVRGSQRLHRGWVSVANRSACRTAGSRNPCVRVTLISARARASPHTYARSDKDDGAAAVRGDRNLHFLRRVIKRRRKKKKKQNKNIIQIGGRVTEKKKHRRNRGWKLYIAD